MAPISPGVKLRYPTMADKALYSLLKPPALTLNSHLISLNSSSLCSLDLIHKALQGVPCLLQLIPMSEMILPQIICLVHSFISFKSLLKSLLLSETSSEPLFLI